MCVREDGKGTSRAVLSYQLYARFETEQETAGLANAKCNARACERRRHMSATQSVDGRDVRRNIQRNNIGFWVREGGVAVTVDY